MMNHTNLQKIVIRMPNWLGDLVMATPILADLRAAIPELEITAMCQGGVGALLKEDPNIDKLYSFSRPTGWLRRSLHGQVVRDLRRVDFDCGLLLTNSFSSAWQFWRAGMPRRIGYSRHWRRLLLTDPVPVPQNIKEQHLVKTYKQLLLPLGVPVSERAPRLYLTDKEKADAQAVLEEVGVLDQEHILVGINPGAAYGSAKCWLPDRFVAVTKRLLEDSRIRVIYFGDSSGAPLVDKICSELPSRVLNFSAKTSLRELMALIDQCDVFLTNDSGPMHICSALGVPLLALFGSTSDVATGPYNQGTVIHKHVECSPCYKRECPIDFRCMTRIGVEEVYSSITQILKNKI